MAFLLGLCLTPACLFAQQSDAEAVSRGIATVPTPDEQAQGDGAAREFDRTPVLPPANLPEDTGQLIGVPSVRVESILLPNGTILSDEQFTAAVAPYTHRVVSVEELNELRHKLSLMYFDLGYVNSGVVLPDQKINGGSVEYREILGGLTDIQLKGNHALNDTYWLARINRAATRPLQINQLQSTLQFIEQHALIKRVEAKLEPGLLPGESSLRLNVLENRPWRIILGADNHRSPSLGSEQLTLYIAHLSVTGRGDIAEVYTNQADGLGNTGASYTLPLGSRGNTVRGWYSGGDAEIVEYPFNQLNIRSKTRDLGTEFAFAFRNSEHSTWLGLLGVQAKHSESTLLDFPFSFSLGEIDGEADTTSVMIGTEWSRRSQSRVFALRLSLNRGTEWGKAAVNPVVPAGLKGPQTKFKVARGQFRYVRRLNWRDSELLLRSTFQLAFGPLLPVEKMPVGGALSVRGYRENLLVRDNGVVASAEWQLPLFQARKPAAKFDWLNLTLSAFTDFGMSWDQDTGLPSDRKEKIYSAGLGLRWSPYPGLVAQVYHGHAFNNVPGSGDDMQDNGWHWRLSYQVF
jgi:hemolysin activation/secretion protein